MMTPLGSRVLVRPVAPDDETDSGLILVREFRDPDVIGDIVACGLQAARIAPELAVGQRIIFPATSGQEVEVDGVRHIILPARDVLAILTEDA